MNANRKLAGQFDAPRPLGGRAAARRTSTEVAYPTQGSAALAAQPVTEPVTERPAGRGAPWLKVTPPAPVSVPRAPFIVLLLVVVVSGVLGILLINTKVNENAFELKNLERQQAMLDRQEQDLKQRIAEYEAPGNLAAQARRLGLVPAEAPAFIRLPDGRIIGVPRPAGGEPSITSGAQQDAGR